MADLWGALGAFAFGGIGWLVTSFVGTPFRKFYDLRSEVIYKSVVYDNVTALEKESPDGSINILERSELEIDRLYEAQLCFRNLAAQMRALALNEPVAMWFVRLRGYDPMKASKAILLVSNSLNRYGQTRYDAKQALEKVLHFRVSE